LDSADYYLPPFECLHVLEDFEITASKFQKRSQLFIRGAIEMFRCGAMMTQKEILF